MVRCLIAIGSNTGDCRQHIRNAVAKIELLRNTRALAVSSLLETAPVGLKTDQVFLNGAVLVETERPALLLIRELLQIERIGGRDRSIGSGNRPIDLDILLYGDQVINQSGLEVPHPRMTFRRFVMQPAVEIAGDMSHPLAGLCLTELLRSLQKQRNVIVVHAPSRQYFSLMQQHVSQQDTRSPSKNPKVHWSFDENRRDVLRSMRHSLSLPKYNWWVLVVESPPESLLFATDAAKLNIYLTKKSLDSDGPLSTTTNQRAVRGPYWRLQLDEPEQIMGVIETAIQSMLPREVEQMPEYRS